MKKINIYPPILNWIQSQLSVPHEKTVVLALEGSHGIGKTEAFTNLEKYGIEIRYINPAQLTESGDLFGLPFIEGNVTKYKASDLLPLNEPDSETGIGILLIDDLTRANPDILQAFMPLLQQKRVGTYVLPDGWLIGLTMNPDNGEYNTNTIDDAFLTRLYKIEYKFNFKSWLDWASENDDEKESQIIETYYEYNEKNVDYICKKMLLDYNQYKHLRPEEVLRKNGIVDNPIVLKVPNILIDFFLRHQEAFDTKNKKTTPRTIKLLSDACAYWKWDDVYENGTKSIYFDEVIFIINNMLDSVVASQIFSFIEKGGSNLPDIKLFLENKDEKQLLKYIKQIQKSVFKDDSLSIGISNAFIKRISMFVKHNVNDKNANIVYKNLRYLMLNGGITSKNGDYIPVFAKEDGYNMVLQDIFSGNKDIQKVYTDDNVDNIGKIMSLIM